jgi:hypothetical protein
LLKAHRFPVRFFYVVRPAGRTCWTAKINESEGKSVGRPAEGRASAASRVDRGQEAQGKTLA